MNAAAYLKERGWRGEGFSLDSADRGLTKRLLVQRKDDSAGLGTSKHDFSNQWWLHTFDKGLKTIGHNAAPSQTTTVPSSQSKSRALYSGFVRGETLSSTIQTITSAKADANQSSAEPTPEMASSMSTIGSGLVLGETSTQTIANGFSVPAVSSKNSKSKKRSQDDPAAMDNDTTGDRRLQSRKDKRRKLELSAEGDAKQQIIDDHNDLLLNGELQAAKIFQASMVASHAKHEKDNLKKDVSKERVKEEQKEKKEKREVKEKEKKVKREKRIRKEDGIMSEDTKPTDDTVHSSRAKKSPKHTTPQIDGPRNDDTATPPMAESLSLLSEVSLPQPPELSTSLPIDVTDTLEIVTPLCISLNDSDETKSKTAKKLGKLKKTKQGSTVQQLYIRSDGTIDPFAIDPATAPGGKKLLHVPTVHPKTGKALTKKARRIIAKRLDENKVSREAVRQRRAAKKAKRVQETALKQQAKEAVPKKPSKSEKYGREKAKRVAKREAIARIAHTTASGANSTPITPR